LLAFWRKPRRHCDPERRGYRQAVQHRQFHLQKIWRAGCYHSPNVFKDLPAEGDLLPLGSIAVSDGLIPSDPFSSGGKECSG
jgi:hypothetical protein